MLTLHNDNVFIKQMHTFSFAIVLSGSFPVSTKTTTSASVGAPDPNNNNNEDMMSCNATFKPFASQLFMWEVHDIKKFEKKLIHLAFLNKLMIQILSIARFSYLRR
jgi:hypothetical protein